MVNRRLLDRAGERDLNPLPANVNECYRLTIRRSWGEHLVIRAECRDNEDIKEMEALHGPGTISPLGMHITFPGKHGGSYTIQRFSHQLVAHIVGVGEGKIRSGDRVLDELQWTTLEVLLRTAHFWELSPDNKKGGMDGNDWELEGVTKSRYHCVHRWCPHPEDDNEWFNLPCLYLCDLACVFGVLVHSGKSTAGN